MYEIRGLDDAQRRYDSEVPDRYNAEPLFECAVCGDEVYSGEGYFCINGTCFCERCVSHYINAEPPFECAVCGDEVYSGEGYFCINGKCFCERCVSHYIAGREDFI